MAIRSSANHPSKCTASSNHGDSVIFRNHLGHPGANKSPMMLSLLRHSFDDWPLTAIHLVGQNRVWNQLIWSLVSFVSRNPVNTFQLLSQCHPQSLRTWHPDDPKLCGHALQLQTFHRNSAEATLLGQGTQQQAQPLPLIATTGDRNAIRRSQMG